MRVTVTEMKSHIIHTQVISFASDVYRTLSILHFVNNSSLLGTFKHYVKIDDKLQVLTDEFMLLSLAFR